VRLASFNLLHGRLLTDGLVVPARLSAAVATLDADVLALQEVDRRQPRTGLRDQTADVAAAARVGGAGGAAGWSSPGAWRFAAAILGTPGERWEAAGEPLAPGEGPSYGVGLVSRLPVLAWHVLRLPAAPVRSPVVIPGPKPRALLLPDEPRVGLAAVVQLAGGGELTVASTHLSFVPGWNIVQLRRLTRWLQGLPQPVVLLGDLNLPGPVPALLPGWRALARHPTFPGPAPRWQLDHALARGGVAAVASSSAVELPISDHRALVVDLTPSTRA